MKKLTTRRILATAVIVMTMSLMALPLITNAQTNTAENLFDLNSAKGIGLGSNTPLKETINSIIKVILGFLGILAVIIILWGGFTWMTAMGDEKKVETAKKLIIAGIIGIIIILAAYAIAQFVITNIGNATGAGDTGT
ncbi:hypothetical protein HZA71_00310 [Candidatus Falkowbacteria bacterium]|nr:hypothetical protein [Candidatus Falkowbacteria bacterium]